MISFAGCWDVRNMVGIHEVDCPRCGKKEGIEVFERDSLTISDSVCSGCGYTIPEGVALEKYLEEHARFCPAGLTEM